MTYHDGLGYETYEDKSSINDWHVLDLNVPVRRNQMTLDEEDRNNHRSIHTNRFPLEPEAEESAAAKKMRMAKLTHNVSTIDNLPPQACYAAVFNESYSYDTGYGDSGRPDIKTAKYIGLIAFDTDEALEYWVLENVGKKSFKIVHLKPVKTEVKMVFSLEK